MKITKNKGSKPFEIEVKRFYLPFTIETKCPECGKILSQDLEDNYLSYPTVGKPEKIHFYCDECEHEFTEEVNLEVNLSV